MIKPSLRLSSNTVEALQQRDETGMGYYAINLEFDEESFERSAVIVGDHVVPSRHDEFVSMSDLFSGEVFPERQSGGVRLRVPSKPRQPVALPPSYTPSLGAIALLGSVTLSSKATFYRFLSISHDHRYVGGQLLHGTYLTTELDRGYANTGFAAVGRYALPIPVPASHLLSYELPVGTKLLIGTVLPNYGQAGGGVEVKTTVSVAATQLKLPKLPDY